MGADANPIRFMDPLVLEQLIEQGRDTPEARLAAGSARLKQDDPTRAIEHLEYAVRAKPDYTMAWQTLGSARQASGDLEGARAAWQRGLEAARANGDKQAEKVMGVYLRRLDKS